MLLFIFLRMLLATFAMRVRGSFRLSLLLISAFPADLSFPGLYAPRLCHFRNCSVLRAGLGTFPCLISHGLCCPLPAYVSLNGTSATERVDCFSPLPPPATLVPSAVPMPVRSTTVSRSLTNVKQERSHCRPPWYSTGITYRPLLSEANYLGSLLLIWLSTHPEHNVPTCIQDGYGRLC